MIRSVSFEATHDFELFASFYNIFDFEETSSYLGFAHDIWQNSTLLGCDVPFIC